MIHAFRDMSPDTVEVTYHIHQGAGVAKAFGFIVATLDHDTEDGYWYVRHDIVGPRHIVRYETLDAAQAAIADSLA